MIHFKRLLLTLAAFLLPASLYAGETVTYKTVESRDLKLFIDRPADWKASDKRPAIVFFFGGGWVGGTPEQFRRP